MTTQRRLVVTNNGVAIGSVVEEYDIWAFEYEDDWLQANASFPVSPAIPLSDTLHRDGSTHRTVQWFFDNLLPEEAMRDVLSREQGVNVNDSFGLLAALGNESAGSLSLLTPGEGEAEKGSQPLTFSDLSTRIRNLPRASLTSESPKRTSLAGAQHKMVVRFDENSDVLSEPLKGSASSHILKPNGQSVEYPHSVINETFTMRLAGMLGLDVPKVLRRYVPEPVYIVERFDRQWDPVTNDWRRLHVIDACQLLDQPRTFKYTSANLETLSSLIDACRIRATARTSIFRWVLFNTLIGNSDSHLKNLSFLIDETGVTVAPFYDLLCTAVYHTRAFADEAAMWPQEPLAIPIKGARVFADVTRARLIETGVVLGLSSATAEREVTLMAQRLPGFADELINQLDREFATDTEKFDGTAEIQSTRAAESRVLRSIRYIVIADMLRLVS